MRKSLQRIKKFVSDVREERNALPEFPGSAAAGRYLIERANTPPVVKWFARHSVNLISWASAAGLVWVLLSLRGL